MHAKIGHVVSFLVAGVGLVACRVSDTERSEPATTIAGSKTGSRAAQDRTLRSSVFRIRSSWDTVLPRHAPSKFLHLWAQ